MTASKDPRIQLHGPFEAKDSHGRVLSVTSIDIAHEGYIADVFVRLSEPYEGALYDDTTFVAYVRTALRSVGYSGPGFERAESGMQGRDFIVLEPNRSFTAFARSKGWKDLNAYDRSWTARSVSVTEPEVKLQEVTFVYHLRPTDRALLEGDYANYSAYMNAVDQMLQNDVRHIPGWFVVDEHDVECEVYEYCEPEGHFPNSDVDEHGPYGHLVLELPIQVRHAWPDGEVKRIAQALGEKLDAAMAGFKLRSSLEEIRSYVRYEHVERSVLFEAVPRETTAE